MRLGIKKASLGWGAIAALAAGLLLPAPAAARVRCSSYSYNTCTSYVCCHVKCVYCLDETTGEVLSEYCSEDCWERTI